MKIWKYDNTLNNSDSIEKIINSFNLYEKYGCILNEKMLEGNMERLKQEMEKDPEFNKRLNSSLKDLSELYPQYRYSFDEEAWNFYTGQILLEARKEAKVTQAELAARTQTTKSYISKIENGVITPSVGVFYRIIAALGMRVEVVQTIY